MFRLLESKKFTAITIKEVHNFNIIPSNIKKINETFITVTKILLIMICGLGMFIKIRKGNSNQEYFQVQLQKALDRLKQNQSDDFNIKIGQLA